MEVLEAVVGNFRYDLSVQIVSDNRYDSVLVTDFLFVRIKSCIERILELESPEFNLTRESSCRFVGEQYPEACGPCNPDTCSGSASETNRPTRSPETFGENATCVGCPGCTASVLETVVNGFTCSEHIVFLQYDSGGNMTVEQGKGADGI